MISRVLTNYGVRVPFLSVTTFTSVNILNILVVGFTSIKVHRGKCLRTKLPPPPPTPSAVEFG